MRYSMGKWIANSKDTWSVETTLNKIVLAHIIKLYDCLKSSKCHGVPMIYVERQAVLDGLDNIYDGDVDKADALRMKDLEELIWTFSDNEPDMDDYNFDVEMISGSPTARGTTPVTFKIVNQEGHDRYHEDLLIYEERKAAGYKLFGEIYPHLSW